MRGEEWDALIGKINPNSTLKGSSVRKSVVKFVCLRGSKEESKSISNTKEFSISIIGMKWSLHVLSLGMLIFLFLEDF